MREKCPHCSSQKTKKNGNTQYGKQNHMCNECGRQFVKGGQEWFISTETRDLIDKLLLERLSLEGILRVTGVSDTWLYAYIKQKYKDLPDDLNADWVLPNEAEYLEDRMDEEIKRLEKKTKAAKKYTQVEDMTKQEIDWEEFGSIEMDWAKELLLNELYGKERSARILMFGLQLDEMWSFVQCKENKQWIWIAYNPDKKQVVAFHVGGRGEKDAQIFYDAIPAIFKQGNTAFFTDYWKPYACVLDQANHFAVGKDSGLTAYIERFNCTLRQRVSRLVRKALSFSKSLENHIGAIKYFICDFNLKAKALYF